jgi:hypothetical protein
MGRTEGVKGSTEGAMGSRVGGMGSRVGAMGSRVGAVGSTVEGMGTVSCLNKVMVGRRSKISSFLFLIGLVHKFVQFLS